MLHCWQIRHVAWYLPSNDQTEDFQNDWLLRPKNIVGLVLCCRQHGHVFSGRQGNTVHENSDVIQWKYVVSKDNPADYASRDVKNFVKNDNWFSGPNFLWQSVDNWPDSFQYTVKDDDPEVNVLKKLKVNVVKTSESNLLNRLVERTSNWYWLKRIVATILRWKYQKSKIDVDLLCKAEKDIIKLVQVDTFSHELHSLQSLSSVIASLQS